VSGARCQGWAARGGDGEPDVPGQSPHLPRAVGDQVVGSVSIFDSNRITNQDLEPEFQNGRCVAM
jgi:hypothetical protein